MISDFIIESNKSIKDALILINKNARGIAFVVDNKQLVGVVTDGDVRRKLLDGFELNDFVKSIMNKDFTYVNKDDNYHHILRQFDKNITILPVIDMDGKPIDLYQYSNFVPNLL